MLKLLLLACAILIVSESRADVIVKYQSKADMANIISLKMDGTESIKGDKSHSAVTTSVDGGMMAMMGNAVPREVVNIVRIDKGLFWELDPSNMVFRETSLDSLKLQLSGEAEEFEDEIGADSEDDYRWTVKFTPIQDKQSINGFECDGYTGTSIGIRKDSPDDTVFITYEQWMTRNPPGAAEVRAYQERYAEVVGVSQMWAQENMTAMLKGYGSQFKILADSLNRPDAFPVRTVIVIESSAAERKLEDETPGKDMSAMMKKMVKDKAFSENGRAMAFSMITEVLSIKQVALYDSQFEIPRGYIKR